MYESPMRLDITDISSQIMQVRDGRLMYEVRQAIGCEIDKEELIKALKYDRDQYQKGYEDGRKDNEWIPVSERLPESAGVYIVTREFTDGFECADLTDACYFDGTSTWHNDNRINHGRAYVDKKIKAWMPLPEPYKAESEEA